MKKIRPVSSQCLLNTIQRTTLLQGSRVISVRTQMKRWAVTRVTPRDPGLRHRDHIMQFVNLEILTLYICPEFFRRQRHSFLQTKDMKLFLFMNINDHISQ